MEAISLLKIQANISVKDIMIAVEEDLDATSCSGSSDCSDGSKCRTHTLWASLNTVVVNYSRENYTRYTC